MQSQGMFRRTVLYAGLVCLTVAAYLLLVSGFSLVVGSVIQPANPWIFGLMLLVVGLVLYPMRARLQRLIDQLPWVRSAGHQIRLDEFESSISKAADLSELVGLIRQTILAQLKPASVHIFLYDSPLNKYCAQADEQGQLTSDIQFSALSGLASHLARGEGILVIENPPLKGELSSDTTRLRLLGSQLFVALPGGERLTGWLALGPKGSGEAYTFSERNYLKALAEQTAVVLSRVRVVADLERRVQELDVLTRVAQGVNITSNFDDLLELIYTQTSQIVPTRDFRVSVYDQRYSQLVLAFSVDNDVRISEREGKILQDGIGLDPEVLRSRRPVITTDYARECWARGLLPDLQGIYAWIGVPLNSAGETLGCISLGSRAPGMAYTPEQLLILQAIADQAAGAMIKARLLRETEE
ncbi:MAG TPA: GAF domain-containing protein, partial [Anaerolineales bacterium]|nr:GAF domain-containing protein [Anaerolineales bacterium]